MILRFVILNTIRSVFVLEMRPSYVGFYKLNILTILYVTIKSEGKVMDISKIFFFNLFLKNLGIKNFYGPNKDDEGILYRYFSYVSDCCIISSIFINIRTE